MQNDKSMYDNEQKRIVEMHKSEYPKIVIAHINAHGPACDCIND